MQYVDGFLWFYRDQKELYKVLQSFQYDGDKYKWEMGVDGTVTEYIGIGIEEVSTDKGKFHLRPRIESKLHNRPYDYVVWSFCLIPI